MIRAIGFLFVVFMVVEGRAQRSWTYNFNGNLESDRPGEGIALVPVGETVGEYIDEVVPAFGKEKRKIYSFSANNGLQFNDVDAKGLLSKSFTIEIYFRFDNLDSWRRVLDFKNRKSDNGCYIYHGKLNFFNFVTGEKAPVIPGRFVHYVYSRDHKTKEIRMYIDGESKISFMDTTGEGTLDQDQLLNFFRDDLVVNHEASAGAVAMIRVYDEVMSPVFVKGVFRNLGKSVKLPNVPVADIKKPVELPVPEAQIAKPSVPMAEVKGRVYDRRDLKAPGDVQVVFTAELNKEIVRTKANAGEYRVMLPADQVYGVTIIAPGFLAKESKVRLGKEGSSVHLLTSLDVERFTAPIATISFANGADSLAVQNTAGLDSAVAFLQRRSDLKVRIEGHTSNLGNFEKNILLSEKRAAAVRSWLIQRGISEDRISVKGYGPVRPLIPNTSADARSDNRRVEIWIESSEKR